MDINISKLEGIVTGVIITLLFGGFFYLAYVVFFTGPQAESSATITTINPSIFGPKIQKAASVVVDASSKISLKKNDIAFTESALYKSFTDIPEIVPPSDSRGRPDPFVPYAAP